MVNFDLLKTLLVTTLGCVGLTLTISSSLFIILFSSIIGLVFGIYYYNHSNMQASSLYNDVKPSFFKRANSSSGLNEKEICPNQREGLILQDKRTRQEA